MDGTPKASKRASGPAKPGKVPARGVPDLRFDFYFVGHGDQIDAFVSGVEVSSVCRDFGGSHRVHDITNRFYKAVVAAIRKTEDKL